jgi:hypothetical protein
MGVVDDAIEDGVGSTRTARPVASGARPAAPSMRVRSPASACIKLASTAKPSPLANAALQHGLDAACERPGHRCPGKAKIISLSGLPHFSRGRRLSDDEPEPNVREPWLTPRGPYRGLPSHDVRQRPDAPLRRSRDARQLAYGFPSAYSLLCCKNRPHCANAIGKRQRCWQSFPLPHLSCLERIDR